jgi:hypothetical protein
MVIPYEPGRAESDSLKHLQAGTAAELDALLPAILDRACKGELHERLD